MSIAHSLLARAALGASSVIPRVLPAAWKSLGAYDNGGNWRRADGLQVIASVFVEADNKRWYHVSLSRPSRLPSWADVTDVKDLFVGTERTAYQVFPTKAKYVNVHPFCLHLWCCLDGDPLPDFTEGRGGLGI